MNLSIHFGHSSECFIANLVSHSTMVIAIYSHVGGEEIKVMEEYKYLGCVVDEYLSNMRMVEERAKAGAKALSDWLRRSIGPLWGK